MEGRGQGGSKGKSCGTVPIDTRDGCRLLHCTENSKHIFPEMKLHGLVLNVHIRVSVGDLNIPVTGLPILLQQIGGMIVLYYSSVLEITRPHSFISGNT